MEFIRNETSGKFVVSLGGVVWNNCSADADCPGYALCSKGRLWQQDAATCICPLSRMVDGAGCDELTPIGVYEVTWYVILGVVALIVAFIAIRAAVYLYTTNKRNLNASIVSLTLAAIGALAQTALCATLVADPLRRVEPDPVTGRRNTYNLGMAVCIPIVFAFSSLAAMNVSLVWIKIADNAIRMKLNSSIDVINYRRALFVYYFILMTLMCAAIVIQSMAQVIVFAMVGIFFVGLTYTITLYKIGGLIKSFTSSSQHGNTESELAGQGSKQSSKVTSPIANSKEVAIWSSDSRPPSTGRSAQPQQSDDSKHQSLQSNKYKSPTASSKEGSGGVKSSLRDIRVLTIRMIIASYLYFIALVLFFTSGGASMFISPATNPVYSRVTHGLIWFQNLVMLTFVVMYLRNLASKKRAKSEQQSAKSAEAAVSPESILQQGTAISSKPASKEDF